MNVVSTQVLYPTRDEDESEFTWDVQLTIRKLYKVAAVSTVANIERNQERVRLDEKADLLAQEIRERLRHQNDQT